MAISPEQTIDDLKAARSLICEEGWERREYGAYGFGFSLHGAVHRVTAHGAAVAAAGRWHNAGLDAALDEAFARYDGSTTPVMDYDVDPDPWDRHVAARKALEEVTGMRLERFNRTAGRVGVLDALDEAIRRLEQS